MVAMNIDLFENFFLSRRGRKMYGSQFYSASDCVFEFLLFIVYLLFFNGQIAPDLLPCLNFDLLIATAMT
jgi:hypothetical protein